MGNKVKMHDGIVGIVYMISIVLGATVSTGWLWIGGVVAALQILSMVTNFCPVYFVLNKLMPGTDPIQSGART